MDPEKGRLAECPGFWGKITLWGQVRVTSKVPEFYLREMVNSANNGLMNPLLALDMVGHSANNAISPPIIGELIMQPYQPHHKANFICRENESARVTDIAQKDGAKILIVYGRRRVGKTELIEQTLMHRNLLKFEGIEGAPQLEQMQMVMTQLSSYAKEPLLQKITVSHWIETLGYIAERIQQGTWTLYFEEVQWLANYEPRFIAALKYVWDNQLRHNPNLMVVLCGSSPSFMISEVIQSRALYNRSQYELPLREFTLPAARKMLPKKSIREVMDAYLTVGGIPEYLLRVKDKRSLYLNLCNESFVSGAFFSREHDKIFTSHLAQNKYYQRIIELLSKRKYATRNDILASLKMGSGGALSELLIDLELCGFIEKYTPFDRDDDSKIVRYCISDSYLQFYFKFIKPIHKQINAGQYDNDPASALNMTRYQQWLGYAFERFCRKYHYIIAKLLGFGAVKYRSGSYFSRRTDEADPGYQIDLLFDRDDRVLTICEIRYTNTPVSIGVIEEFERKLSLLSENPKKTIERVLITLSGANQSVTDQHYFDTILTLEDIFEEHAWR